MEITDEQIKKLGTRVTTLLLLLKNSSEENIKELSIQERSELVKIEGRDAPLVRELSHHMNMKIREVLTEKYYDEVNHLMNRIRYDVHHIISITKEENEGDER